ncbi:hypothetical protein HanRHA438_Chr15g0713431 [Helianthus annuus]|nr:hypothetical protein HanIR_Chr15g0762531 [Helianthus annuus]KAJ0845418.1 hypothetical protein HanRHA438_Chr15g0713431 [Helianthus annuus]
MNYVNIFWIHITFGNVRVIIVTFYFSLNKCNVIRKYNNKYYIIYLFCIIFKDSFNTCFFDEFYSTNIYHLYINSFMLIWFINVSVFNWHLQEIFIIKFKLFNSYNRTNLVLLYLNYI